MSEHMLSQEQIDALVKSGDDVPKKAKEQSSGEISPQIQELYRVLEPVLGEAIASLTGAQVQTVSSGLYVEAAASLGDSRYLISLGSTEDQIDVLICLEEEAAATIIKKIKSHPEDEELFNESNMSVFGEAIKMLEKEFSNQVSASIGRYFNLALALPKGPSGLHEFLDPLGDYLVLEYTLKWEGAPVGAMNFIMKDEDAKTIFQGKPDVEGGSSIKEILDETSPYHDEDILAELTEDFTDIPETGDEIVVKPVQFGQLSAPRSKILKSDDNLDIILDLPVTLTVELGRTKRTMEEILSLNPGSVVELDRLAGEPVDILANGVFVAKGEVVVIDETFGVKITEIASKTQRLDRIK